MSFLDFEYYGITLWRHFFRRVHFRLHAVADDRLRCR